MERSAGAFMTQPATFFTRQSSRRDGWPLPNDQVVPVRPVFLADS
jgi:hypothetical protein